MAKYIKFMESDELVVILVVNKKDRSQIGMIDYYPKWEEWVFTPRFLSGNPTFSAECLETVKDKLNWLNKNRKPSAYKIKEMKKNFLDEYEKLLKKLEMESD